ncbi:MAG: cobaltochelatase subunit CobN [Roseiflexaceae bacterium]|nr:cobaltochelatase subunit CobN [Roseiflexaceae bacterium]
MAELLLARHAADVRAKHLPPSPAGALASAADAADVRAKHLPQSPAGALASAAAEAADVRAKHLPQSPAGALASAADASPLPATPETIALTLWSMDTIKTEGESLAVVLALIGARPERDGQGKIWRYQLIPLEELGRPRVDVLLDISPIFRDTFQMSLDLLDDMFRRAAAAAEPEQQNFVRAHALAMQRGGGSWDDATARIFTQAPGQYGTGVDELIDEGQWQQNDDLAEMYTRRGAHAYGGNRAGAAAPATLRALLGTVDHVFQAIDSVEYGITDISHYYGHGGAIQLAAAKARGESVPLTYAESFTGTIKLAGAEELIQLEARSKLLNPRWYEGMLNHGFAGAAEIGQRFTYLLGWSAVSGNVANWIFDDAAATFVLDDAMRTRLEQANPQAARNAVARLLEANGRGLWQTDEATLDRLQALYGDLEDRLEGVAIS